MVYPHHLAAPQPHQGQQWHEIALVRPGGIGPYIKDTDLRLGGTKGGIDDGYEGDPFLQKVITPSIQRYAGQLRVCRRKNDPLPRKRVKRLQDQPVTILR